jgi:DNA modification methylase
VIQGDNWQVHIGSNLDVLPTLPDNSVDSIVTDPPYELGFMGKKWDSSGIAYSTELWRECLRVLKPGGHLLSFGGTRTWHRVAVAIEDSGFEVRDSIAWMYGSGFPKSLDISKAIDKAAGAEREVVTQTVEDLFGEREEEKKTVRMNEASGLVSVGQGERTEYTRFETAPSTPEAQQWEGWGTALKPAFEPIVVARKPLIGTVAQNVLTHGTGGLNIDGSRIGTGTGEKKTVSYPDIRGDNYQQGKESYSDRGTVEREVIDKGRWPSNVILDPYTAELLDEQSGAAGSGSGKVKVSGGRKSGSGTWTSSGGMNAEGKENIGIRDFGDTGGASRFFYVAKASKRDRNEGLEELEPQRHSDREKDDGVGGDNPRNRTNQARQNFHPTVKPTALMRYLVKLVTPPGGTVLDPFTGSGSTGKAAILEGFDFIGIELTEDYIPIIEGRLKHAVKTKAEEADKDKEQLF